MNDTEGKEFSIEGMLDNKREIIEKVGFIDDQRSGMIKKMIMSCYKKEFIKEYELNSLTWSSEEERYFLKWRKRPDFEVLDEEGYQKEFEFLIKK